MALSVTGVLIAVDGAAGRSPFVAGGKHLMGSLSGPLSGLGDPLTGRRFVVLILVMSGAYALLVLCADALPARSLLAAIVAFHVLFLLAPPLLSTDVFSYLGYARLGALHGIDPYAHGAASAPHDAVYAYVPHIWRHAPTVYGPLFTVASYPLALLGLAGGLWALKLLAAASGLGCVALVWLCARRLRIEPLRPVVLVGLSPLWVVYGVGGAHNDLSMLALMVAGAWLVLANRERWGAAAVVGGAAVKVTAAALLPFILLARPRRDLVIGMAAAGAALAMVALAVFGPHALAFVGALHKQQLFVSSDSFPNEVAHLFGLPGVIHSVRLAAHLLLVVVIVYLLVGVWRGAGWIAAAGWAMLTLAVTTTWLLAWYTFWSLPLAAFSRDRRLIVATLVVQALFLVHQVGPLFT